MQYTLHRYPTHLESDDGELTTPAHGDGQGTEESEELVAASLAAVEAHVRVHPATVKGVSSLWLSYHILEQDLRGRKHVASSECYLKTH